MKYTLFVDLDGVLADFDKGVKDLTGKLPQDLHPKAMWPRLAKTPGFYDSLDWMPDGKELWEAVLPHGPIILTGLPIGSWAEPQKRSWCARILGEAVEVITCKSREKASIARQRSGESTTPILIDDREKLKDDWEAMGGVFIHHRSAKQSIAALKSVLEA